MNKKEMLLKEKYGRVRGGQSDLARDLETIQSTVKRWFTDGSIPSPDYIEKLAKVFGKTEEEIKDIFGGNKKNFQQQNISGAGARGSQTINEGGNKAPKSSNAENELLKKEIELLKKEIELLKKEMEFQQRRKK